MDTTRGPETYFPRGRSRKAIFHILLRIPRTSYSQFHEPSVGCMRVRLIIQWSFVVLLIVANPTWTVYKIGVL